ncbi:MAG: hypothetical protein KDB80_12065 [Planctomycetes bacterium]|nr:hypothetical protein [Planctomycetota bacterium]
MNATSPAVLLATCLAISAPAQHTEIRIAPERTNVEFGQPFHVTIERRWPADLVVSPWHDGMLEPLTVIGSDVTSARSTDSIDERRMLEVACFATGTITLPPITIVSARPDGSVVETASTEPLVFEVTTSIGEPRGEIEPPDAPATSSPLPAILVIALGLLVNFGAVIWVFRRRGDSPDQPNATETARAALVSADGTEADRVSTALRGFVEDSWALPSRAMSTDELAIHDSLRSRPNHAELLELLTICDRARFVGGSAPPDLIDRARTWLAAANRDGGAS